MRYAFAQTEHDPVTDPSMQALRETSANGDGGVTQLQSRALHRPLRLNRFGFQQSDDSLLRERAAQFLDALCATLRRGNVAFSTINKQHRRVQLLLQRALDAAR